jgi:hypothetical protein
MKLKLVVSLAGLAVLGVPASAGAAGFTGVVAAKQPARGALVLALPGGHGLTVRAPLGGVRLGDRVSLQGVRLADGTVRATHLTLGRRIHLLRIRGVVVRQLARSTLLATGRSVIRIHHGRVRALAAALDHGGLDAGEAATFTVRVGDDDRLEQVSVTPSAQTGSVRIEGKVVSTSPFVVSVEGLPVTITVPSGTTLPAGLAPGQRVELAVEVAPNNVFTLASLDQENGQQAQGDEQGDDDQGDDGSGDGDGGHDGGGHDGGDG